jgi:hypothetical protein
VLDQAYKNVCVYLFLLKFFRCVVILSHFSFSLLSSGRKKKKKKEEEEEEEEEEDTELK